MAVAIVSVLVGGCGSEPETQGVDPTPSSNAGTEQTQGTDDQGSGGSPADIEAVLLTADDLPDGWVEVADDGGESDSCLDRLTDPDGPFKPSESVNRSFAESDLGPFLLAVVTSNPADEVLVAADEVLVACDGHTTDSGFTSRFESTSIPDLPPDAMAVRGTETSEEGGSLDLVAAAAGADSGTVLVLGVTPLGDVDDVIVSDAVTTMVDRLP